MSIRKVSSKSISADTGNYIGKAGELLLVIDQNILVIADGINTVDDLINNGRFLSTPDPAQVVTSTTEWNSTQW